MLVLAQHLRRDLPGMRRMAAHVSDSEVSAIGLRFTWVLATTVLIMVTTAIVVLARTPRVDHSPPELHIDSSVAPDFELLALDTWDQFVEAFKARDDCFGDVTLRAACDLDSRATYDPDTSTVTVRVPGTPAMLQAALVHEWAHHIEFQCEEQKEVRPGFISSLGMAPDTPWRPSAPQADMPARVWAEIPSEQWAEAAVVLVLESRHIPTKATVKGEALRILREWAEGMNPQDPSGE
jgi:hypothetical protein